MQESRTSSIQLEVEAARKLLKATQSGLGRLEADWDADMVLSWSQHVAESKGRVVLCGMGKSGLIAQKIAATFASTGCPSFFMHPAEALHGDLGMVTADDTMLVLSNSGETEEIIRLLPSLLRIGVPIGAITLNRESRLGQAARWCFTYALPEGEGCPLNFAPMTSTTLQLVWGDLLAVAQMIHSGFTLERFAQFHPAGNIGARLLNTKDVMRTMFPSVEESATLVQVLGAMTHGKLGMTTVVKDGALQGVISDGDIRRSLEKAQEHGANPLDLKAIDVMTRHPVSVPPASLAVEAARIMESKKITFLIVKEGDRVQGVLHIHDLLANKVI